MALLGRRAFIKALGGDVNLDGKVCFQRSEMLCLVARRGERKMQSDPAKHNS